MNKKRKILKDSNVCGKKIPLVADNHLIREIVCVMSFGLCNSDMVLLRSCQLCIAVIDRPETEQIKSSKKRNYYYVRSYSVSFLYYGWQSRFF